MKKEIHLPVHKIVFTCLYCDQKYQTVSTSPQNISCSSCSSCSPFYTGTSASEIRTGAVEKYRQREIATKEKLKKT